MYVSLTHVAMVELVVCTPHSIIVTCTKTCHSKMLQTNILKTTRIKTTQQCPKWKQRIQNSPLLHKKVLKNR